jgi:hypothetical protein
MIFLHLHHSANQPLESTAFHPTMFNHLILGTLISHALAYDTLFAFDSAPEIEKRSIASIYNAALAEGGVVTCWHGGDETNQQDALKSAFEAAFPGLILNITVDLSKYHDGKIDELLVNDDVYVDSVILQTLHDYPRWASEGALLNYAPLGFDQIDPAYKDSTSAAWYGVTLWSWSFIWNTAKLHNATLKPEFPSLLDPALKDKLVLTYPNDDDAILYAFDLMYVDNSNFAQINEHLWLTSSKVCSDTVRYGSMLSSARILDGSAELGRQRLWLKI